MPLDISTLEKWLWDAACAIHGPLDAPKFKDYILPLVFLKRLSDVFEDELARLAEEYGSRDMAIRIVEQERDRGIISTSCGSLRFYIPENALWPNIRNQTTGLGQYLTDAVREVPRENPRLQRVIDVVDFNATAAGQRIVSDDYLARLVDVLPRHRLGLVDVEPDILGRAYDTCFESSPKGRVRAPASSTPRSPSPASFPASSHWMRRIRPTANGKSSASCMISPVVRARCF